MWKWFNQFLDTIESRWALWLLIGGNTAITGLGAYIAQLTDWMSIWGPLGYLFAGLSCALAFSVCLFLIGAFMKARAVRLVHLRRAEKSTRINILNDLFEGEIIHVHDLWSFQHQLLENKRFHNCRFVGPMVVCFLNNVTVNGFFVYDCNFIEIGSSTVSGVVGFENCIFTQCQFDNVTFLIHQDMKQALVDSCRGEINFVARP